MGISLKNDFFVCIINMKVENMGYGSRDQDRFGSNRSFGGPREMHKAVCADCGNECEVPFKPTEGKPVYCRECYPKHKRF